MPESPRAHVVRNRRAPVTANAVIVAEPLELRRLFAAGALDTTFGNGGATAVDNNGLNENVGRVLLQPDQKVLIAGGTGDNSTGHYDFILARLDPDGTPDATFGGGDGIALNSYWFNDRIYDLALQADGKIVGAGGGGNGVFQVLRFNADGSPDTSFGSDGTGIVSVPVPDESGHGSGGASSVVVQPDGRIVIGGTSLGGTASLDFALIRFNSDGSLDRTFGGGDGISLGEIKGGGYLSSLLLTPDGKFVAGCTHGPDLQRDFTIARFNADGTLDRGYGGGDGIVTADFGADDQLNDMTFAPDGGVIAVGVSKRSFVDDLGDMAVFRVDADGNPAAGFGTAGKVRQSWPFAITNYESAFGVVVNAGGKIIVTGSLSGWTGLLALNADGTLDTRFGTGGLVTSHVGFWMDGNAGAALRADGRILVGGNYDLLPPPKAQLDLGVARYLGPSTPLTARAGGPFSLAEGERVILQGDASGDPDAPITAFEWDLDYDGTTFDVDVSGPAAPLYTPAGIDGREGTRVAAFRVRDSKGNVSNVSTTTITVRNVAPTVGIEGSTDSRPEGRPVNLSAAVSDPSDADRAAGFTYAWTVTRDGQPFASGSAKDFSFTPDDDGAYAVGLTVTDKDGGSGAATARVEATNAAPTLDLADPAPANPVPFQAVKFMATLADPGAADRLEVSWDFGDGTGVDFHATGAGANAAAHAYRAPGEYTVTARVRDDDDASATKSLKVKVEPVAVQTAPCDPAQKWLAMGGTAGNDVILFSLQGRSGVRVSLNGKSSGPFSDVARVFAFGGPGRDFISVSGGVRAPALLDGGEGNDFLIGGAGDDVLLGGPGLDVLVGLQGHDTLVGGMGFDLMLGGRNSTRYEGDADVTVTCAGITVTPTRRRMDGRDGGLLG